MIHHTTLRVQFRDLDSYAHVNHAVYVTWFEIARTDALRDLGIALVGPEAAAAAVRGHGAGRALPPTGGGGGRRAHRHLASPSCAAHRRGGDSSCGARTTARDELLVEANVRVGIVGPDGRPMAIPAELRYALRGSSES